MKRTVKALTCALAFSFAFSAVACARNPAGSGNTEKIDHSRTQLFVFNFDGGYGTEWLNAVKTRYEELHKDDVWEEGKKGVQIWINAKKSNATAIKDQILDNRDEVYFTEYAYYYALKSEGLLGDITEAVTTDIGYGDGEGSTIVSKLTDEQKTYYGISENGTEHYYGIPHYAGYNNIVYNVDLFDEKGYYFVDGYDASEITDITDYFIFNATDKKSAGPDGEYDTADDGLPVTYEEFFILCDYISSGGDTPMTWTGADYRGYLRGFGHTLAVDHEGLEQSMLLYNMGDGTINQATNLGRVVSGQFVRDSQPTTITTSNVAEVFRQEGFYQSLKFVEKLVSNDKYHVSTAFNSAYSHMNAQEDFLWAGYDNGITAPIAMLIDGIWWESEATGTFNEMTDSKGQSFSKTGRKFAMMPLPRASANQTSKSTLYDHINSMVFMKANVAEWKKPLAYDFIKFVNSNESLVEFTQITNTPKALDYTMTEDQLSKMSYYGRSVMQMKQKSDIVYPQSKQPSFINNQSRFNGDYMYYTIVDRKEYQYPASAFYENKISSQDYFNGMYTYYNDNWKDIMGR